MKARKILFLGAISEGQTSQMRMRALERLGYQVRGVDTIKPWARASWLARQSQRRLGFGSVVDGINRAVISAARECRPEIVWGEKQEYIRPSTLAELHKLGAKLVHFTPDPYFTLDWKRTRLMDTAIGQFDVLVFCKSYERSSYEALGKPLVYMPLGYSDEVHRPIPEVDPRWICDVGFLGGWEPRREHMLHAVAATGASLKIWGVAWDFVHDGRWNLRRHLILRQLAGSEPYAIHKNPMLAAAHQGGEVYADDYARALSGAQIGLGFLRTVCPDQHTTRTFEIPACASMLIADRTEEHREFFEEGKEAEFFSSQDEMLDKLEFYGRKETVRKQIAEAGYQRCVSNRYAYIHRMSDAMMRVESHLADAK